MNWWQITVLPMKGFVFIFRLFHVPKSQMMVKSECQFHADYFLQAFSSALSIVFHKDKWGEDFTPKYRPDNKDSIQYIFRKTVETKNFDFDGLFLRLARSQARDVFVPVITLYFIGFWNENNTIVNNIPVRRLHGHRSSRVVLPVDDQWPWMEFRIICLLIFKAGGQVLKIHGHRWVRWNWPGQWSLSTGASRYFQ